MFRESERNQLIVNSEIQSSKSAGGVMLIVEDYERIRQFFARHYKKNGYRVYSAVRIGDAVGLAHSVLPTVILVDYDLERENIFDALKKLHDAVPGSRIIVLGGIESPEIRAKILAFGGTDFVPHGYDIENLDSLIGK